MHKILCSPKCMRECFYSLNERFIKLSFCCQKSRDLRKFKLVPRDFIFLGDEICQAYDDISIKMDLLGFLLC